MTNDLFDYNLTEQYRLCLRISAERFTFALHDETGKPAFYSRDYSTDRERSLTANLKTIFKDNPSCRHPARQHAVCRHPAGGV